MSIDYNKLKEYYRKAIAASDLLPEPADVEIRTAAETILTLLDENQRLKGDIVTCPRCKGNGFIHVDVEEQRPKWGYDSVVPGYI